MDAAQMANRCPTAQRLGTGVLHDYRFRIDGRGFATVTPENGACVVGVVWNLTDSDSASLDTYEGVPKFYIRKNLPILFEQQTEEMLVFISTNTDVGRGRAGYLERIIAAAEANLFPDTYQREIRSWMIAQDS